MPSISPISLLFSVENIENFVQANCSASEPKRRALATGILSQRELSVLSNALYAKWILWCRATKHTREKKIHLKLSRYALTFLSIHDFIFHLAGRGLALYIPPPLSLTMAPPYLMSYVTSFRAKTWPCMKRDSFKTPANFPSPSLCRAPRKIWELSDSQFMCHGGFVLNKVKYIRPPLTQMCHHKCGQWYEGAASRPER